MANQPRANIIPFTARRILEPDEGRPVGLPPAAYPAPPPAAPITAPIDLTGKPKVWFAIGPGRSGKTTLLRWVSEISASRGSYPIMAAADPQNRSLKDYIENVAEPPTNDATATARWLEALLRFIMDGKGTKQSALVDLGGGDTSLQKLLVTVPTLAEDLNSAGVATVAVYAIGPRVDDLASLASFEAMGFRPAATALLRNEGLTDSITDREDAFIRIMRHNAYRQAFARGAVELWMPRLDAAVAQEIEAKRLGFFQARDAISPAGRSAAPLGGFDRTRVRAWLEAMNVEMAPIMSWLP